MAATGCDCRFKDPLGARLSLEQYQELFKPSEYLKFIEAGFSSHNALPRHTLQCYHEFFKSVPNGVKVLDFGTGPVMLSTISAATKASEIVLADYSEANLAYLRQWLQNDPQAYDWSPYFRYVVQELEGVGDREMDEREKQVRQLVKDVVHCDITQDPPIDKGYDQLYDVVVCSLVLEGASDSREEYRANAARLAKLVKPGGALFCYGIENKNGYYVFGNQPLPNIHLCHECWLGAFSDAGFCDPKIRIAPTCDPNRQYRFISCTRKTV